MAVFLPKINYMEVVGFNKIFKDNFVTIDFHALINILLGGNGLGKTTLLQCIVYALTGGMSSPEVESNKNYRWNNDFFKRRVLPDELNSANILINFNLGDCEISVRRGLISNRALEYYVNNQEILGKTFDDIVVEAGQYDNFDSFVFIVNRLLYLPENRRSLTWDYDGQVRSLMILSNDIINEKAYRSLRSEIKNLDSTKRHTTVRINKIEKREDRKAIKTVDNTTLNIEIDSTMEQRPKLNELLKINLIKREECSISLKGHEKRRQELAEEIEVLAKMIRKYEAEYLTESLQRYGAKETLLFGKTVNHGICPCCGEMSNEYQQLAKQRISEGKCLVCGAEHFNNTNIDVADINVYNSQLNEKLSARDNANKHIIHLRNQIQSIDEEIFSIRKRISDIDYSTFVNADRADDNWTSGEEAEDIEDSEAELFKLISDRDNLESDIRIKTEEADNIYESFLNNFTERNNQLSVIYQDLASAFLGKPVTLEYEKSPAKFVSIDYLIPVFDGEARRNPEDCSEAQRFFLDIAFRMSLIILNYNLTQTTGTFICETPESALDVSYVDNVVKMFFKFTENGNRLILSNNLQKLGLASLMVNKAKNEGTEYSVFDLLEYGRLSDVQQKFKDLFYIRDEIISGEIK